jgi:hypothetical protein
MKRSSARRARRWVTQELTRLLDQRKPKESYGTAADGFKLTSAASQRLVRWTALIGRLRRRRDWIEPP